MPATAPTPAETSTRLNRSASRSLSASSLRLRSMANADDRGDVEPADRQEVRQAASTHRLGVVLVHRVLVAGRQAR